MEETDQTEPESLTLTEAISQRYDFDSQLENLTSGVIINMQLSPSRRLSESESREEAEVKFPRLTTAGLTGMKISDVGIQPSLSKVSPNLRDLNLSHNKISDWSAVQTILTELPLLATLDLSGNPLDSNQAEQLDVVHNNLRNLQLNALTAVTENTLVKLADVAPSLEELALCRSGLENIATSFKWPFSRLRVLRLQGNKISSLQDLGPLATSALDTLWLSENPITEVVYPEDGYLYLTNLCLTETQVEGLPSLQQLALFPALKHLRLQNSPLLEELDKPDRRLVIISSVPHLSLLNNSQIVPSEVETAERFTIRQYADCDEKPWNYAELVQRHGALTPIVDINIGPRSPCFTLQLYCQGKFACDVTFRNTGTVRDIRRRILATGKVTSKKFLLYHYDLGVMDEPEMLISDNLPVSRYDFRDGSRLLADWAD